MYGEDNDDGYESYEDLEQEYAENEKWIAMFSMKINTE